MYITPTLYLSAFLTFLSCSTLCHAYITDLKITTCDEHKACPTYPFYRLIDVDLNSGVSGAHQVYLHYRDDTENDPITGLHVGTVSYNLSGWIRLDGNLNAGISGNRDLWFYYTKNKAFSQSPIDSIVIKKGKNPIAASAYKRIPVDLNQDVGGDQLYLFYSQAGSQSPITALAAKSCISQDCYLDGWHRVDKDLNHGTVLGFWIYLFYQQEPGKPPVTDIALIIDNQTPPEGYLKVDVDLNKGTVRGSSIWLWYKAGNENEDSQSIEVVSIEYGPEAVTPFGFTKLDVDLNYGAQGEETYLMFRRSYSAPPRAPPLTFRDDGTFKILQLADMHITNGQSQCYDVPTEMVCMGNKNTLDFMVRLLEAEVPDLVVFTGDNVNGQSSSDVRAAILRYSRPVVDRRIPWAMVYGDHDDEGDLTREEMFQTIQEIPYALTEKGPVDVSGVGNYVVKIYKNISEETREEQSSGRQIRAPQQEHAFTLYFLDSHSQSNAGPGVYNHINQDQLDWLLMASRSFSVVKDGKEQSKPNAIAFVHAPIPEYNELELGGRPRAIMGDKRETVSSAPSEVVQGKIFETFRKAGDIKLATCGKNHVNDYCFNLDGVALCYGGGMGYGTYGASHLNWPRRARVFELRDSTVTTWKRLDDDKLSMLHFETLVF